MKFGVSQIPTDYACHPGEVAKAAEERGFESLFFPEHTHIPSRRISIRPSGSDVSREYYHAHDPFVALATAAANTATLRIGTGICLVVQRDPIILAREVASIDRLSGGRFLFGIGGGWNREEMANHGTDYASRWKLLRERIEAMKEIWNNEEATYRGEFVNFEAIWCWPKPVQRPHPPILLGGDSERNMQRVVRYCDEWMPHARDLKTFADKIEKLNALAAEAGRGPIPVTVFGAPSEPARIEGYREDGISRCVFSLPAAGLDEVLPVLDRLEELVRELGG